MDLHLKKKAFDRRMVLRAGLVYALVGFLFSIWLSYFNGGSSVEMFIYKALLCTILNWLVGFMLGGYTTLYDRSKKVSVKDDGELKVDGHGCP